MRIAIAPATFPHESAFLDAIGETLRELGHEVVELSAQRGIEAVIQWGGKVSDMCLHRDTLSAPHIHVECGWLPRWSYQVSWSGINAKHHAAGEWNMPLWYSPLDPEPLRTAKAPAGFRHYADPNVEPHTGGEPFYLCPLQVPTDVNMGALPEEMRTPQGLVKCVMSFALGKHYALKTPLPRVYFKQHPAMSEREASVSVPPPHKYLRHQSGQIHSYLKSPQCLGVIVGNSNVFHDALLWGKTATALGDGFWGKGPVTMGPGTGETNAYLRHVLANQWALEDAQDAAKVERLLEGATKC